MKPNGKGKLDRTKLAKLLGLLGSNHDGEMLAAAHAANRTVVDAGMTWEEAVNPPPQIRTVTVSTASASWDSRTLTAAIMAARYTPDSREADFLNDMQRRRSAATAAQIRWLKHIAVNAGVL